MTSCVVKLMQIDRCGLVQDVDALALGDCTAAAAAAEAATAAV